MPLSTTEKVVIGGVAVGAVAYFLKKKSSAVAAQAPVTSATASQVPSVPANASVTTNPATTMIPFATKQSIWPAQAAAGGQQAGTYTLLQNAANPSDWVLVFTNAANTGAGIVSYGTTQNSGLLAQALAASGAAAAPAA